MTAFANSHVATDRGWTPAYFAGSAAAADAEGSAAVARGRLCGLRSGLSSGNGPCLDSALREMHEMACTLDFGWLHRRLLRPWRLFLRVQ